ncbi:MAG: outer membrane protein assembly factor BamE [Proteobacteria bacterium]|jgi:outer membrane protein assembly factor BamE (lipoprotein component of BamABCDE complex)|nr:outer membrane protein assembly factor BamE [Pseudomonadota bacterium]|tara:strand:+ start:2196 stop:2627 length:432 start_codon:yes stop_codon:yes gene_type:complete
MTNFKFFIIFFILFISSCSEKIHTNGLSLLQINQMDIKIGEVTKNQIYIKYGPPIFESVFNKNVIYYLSHKSSYLNFNPRETKELVVLEITFNNKNIVKSINKYSEKNAKNVNVSMENTTNKNNQGEFFKQIIDNLKRNNLKN